MSSSDDARRAIEARCLAALGRREYSRAELAAKLGDYPPEDIAAVLDHLAERGWQSDARFAESYLRGHRGYGRLKMRHELEQRGIRGELLRETLDSADWFAAAREVYQKNTALRRRRRRSGRSGSVSWRSAASVTKKSSKQ